MSQTAFVVLIGIAFMVVFVTMWVGVCVLVSKFGGWSRLARDYPAIGRVDGAVYRWSSARLKLFTSYSNCLTVTISSSGILMVPIIFLKVGHTPILIPRQAVIEHEKGLLPMFRSLALKVKMRDEKQPITLTFYGNRLCAALEQWLED